jgi:hypothetical protein
MRKIPTVFERDEETQRRFVKNEVNPAAKWVLDGEGIATRKYDGTCVMFDGTGWWVRREVKPGKDAPANFLPMETDETTGKTVGWELAHHSGFSKFLDEALATWDMTSPNKQGTYELCGPRINQNPEGFDHHVLIPHGQTILAMAPAGTGRTFHNLRSFLSTIDYEGIVWHHPDGRMAKLKKRDFPKVSA